MCKNKIEHNEEILVEILNRIMNNIIQTASERSQVYRLLWSNISI